MTKSSYSPLERNTIVWELANAVNVNFPQPLSVMFQPRTKIIVTDTKRSVPAISWWSDWCSDFVKQHGSFQARWISLYVNFTAAGKYFVTQCIAWFRFKSGRNPQQNKETRSKTKKQQNKTKKQKQKTTKRHVRLHFNRDWSDDVFSVVELFSSQIPERFFSARS